MLSYLDPIFYSDKLIGRV